MPQRKRFVHIGYPKCASTTLQYDLFGAHPKIYHLGWGCQNGVAGWPDENIAAAFEVDLRMAKTHQYDITKAQEALRRHFAYFRDNEEQYQAIGMSWESLCYTLAYDVDPFIKASRLFDLFGYGTKIIIVIRNQFDLLRSMYFEMVRDGLSKPFAEYLEFLYYHQYASLTGDLVYSEIVKIYGDLFGYENLLIVQFEKLIAHKQAQINRLCSFIGVDPIKAELGRHNASEDRKKLEHIRRHNLEHRHNFGNELFSFLDAQKHEAYWARENMALSSNAINAIKAQKDAYSTALSSFVDTVPEIDAEFSGDFHQIFSDLFAESNRRIQKDWKLDLAAHGYPL